MFSIMLVSFIWNTHAFRLRKTRAHNINSSRRLIRNIQDCEDCVLQYMYVNNVIESDMYSSVWSDKTFC